MSPAILAGSILENGADLFGLVDIQINTSKHVKPVATHTIKATVSGKVDEFKTITKYTYFESGTKWIKVLLSDLAGLKDHP